MKYNICEEKQKTSNDWSFKEAITLIKYYIELD